MLPTSQRALEGHTVIYPQYPTNWRAYCRWMRCLPSFVWSSFDPDRRQINRWRSGEKESSCFTYLKWQTIAVYGTGEEVHETRLKMKGRQGETEKAIKRKVGVDGGQALTDETIQCSVSDAGLVFIVPDPKPPTWALLLVDPICYLQLSPRPEGGLVLPLQLFAFR